ncbi:ZINC FINGER PROTEIN-LIKE 1 [Salix koriyanagi]|uniref:ZINC FINGER PROTEIN-LIKE 1 n=1 Tax=Salix koriyanagi TaxID=2511006 RepID=A0A9Q0X1Q8_9ROSI|nr:ZINC FINGER PROTEIN-LIKE 1 [Salix koriyanagi]
MFFCTAGIKDFTYFSLQTCRQGLEKNLFGNHPVSLPAPPPKFTSAPLVAISSPSLLTKDETGTGFSKISVSDIVEIDSPNSAGAYMKNSSPGIPGAATRKVGVYVEQQNSELSYYADDEDGNHKKYSRRGPFRHKFLRALLPFWSSALPTLPVTAPPRKDASNTDNPSEGRTRQKAFKDRSEKDPPLYSNHGLYGNYGHIILQNCTTGFGGGTARCMPAGQRFLCFLPEGGTKKIRFRCSCRIESFINMSRAFCHQPLFNGSRKGH